MKLKQSPVSYLVRGALIAAAYTVLVYAVYPISFGAVQLRVAEALCVLPFIFPESIPGIFIGCIAANAIGLFMGLTTPWDVVIGPIATLIAAFLTSRCKIKWLAPLPPVICNALIIGPMLAFMFSVKESWAVVIPLNILSVGAGEAVVCFALGLPLLILFDKLGIKKEHPYGN